MANTLIPSYILLNVMRQEHGEIDSEIIETICTHLINPLNQQHISHDYYLTSINCPKGQWEQEPKLDKLFLWCASMGFVTVKNVLDYFDIKIDIASQKEKEIFALNILAEAMEGVEKDFGNLDGLEKL